jgi:hypothetical protein
MSKIHIDIIKDPMSGGPKYIWVYYISKLRKSDGYHSFVSMYP